MTDFAEDADDPPAEAQSLDDDFLSEVHARRESIVEAYLRFERLMKDDTDGTLTAANAVFGVGVLAGAGYPGAAAAMAVLLKKAYPDDDWLYITQYRRGP